MPDADISFAVARKRASSPSRYKSRAPLHALVYLVRSLARGRESAACSPVHSMPQKSTRVRLSASPSCTSRPPPSLLTIIHPGPRNLPPLIAPSNRASFIYCVIASTSCPTRIASRSPRRSRASSGPSTPPPPRRPWPPSRMASGARNIRRSARAGDGDGTRLCHSMPSLLTCVESCTRRIP